ncbi:hypothetical protein DFH27DRAFT_617315 [Peziza echinospora]|nr:hypothetical protein DFH27DRAFT_617315 [Peziza echinospora]
MPANQPQYERGVARIVQRRATPLNVEMHQVPTLVSGLVKRHVLGHVHFWLCTGADQGHGTLHHDWLVGPDFNLATSKVGLMTYAKFFEKLLEACTMLQRVGGSEPTAPLQDLAKAWRRILFGMGFTDKIPAQRAKVTYTAPGRSEISGFVKEGLVEWDAFIQMRALFWDCIQKYGDFSNAGATEGTLLGVQSWLQAFQHPTHHCLHDTIHPRHYNFILLGSPNLALVLALLVSLYVYGAVRRSLVFRSRAKGGNVDW